MRPRDTCLEKLGEGPGELRVRLLLELAQLGLELGITPTVALEKQVLNMIGNLVYIKWLSCVAKRQSNTTQPSARLSSVLDGSDPSMGTDAASAA